MGSIHRCRMAPPFWTAARSGLVALHHPPAAGDRRLVVVLLLLRTGRQLHLGAMHFLVGNPRQDVGDGVQSSALLVVGMDDVTWSVIGLGVLEHHVPCRGI